MTDARRWMSDGTDLLRAALDRLADPELDQATQLPGWSRRHLLAHVAANGDALRRLARWARTGREQRMYASPEQRNAEIEAGSRLPAGQLRRWVEESGRQLAADLGALSEAGWRAELVTAQGRAVPASEIPWLRARELLVHAVDLGSGVDFADLPTDFLVRLTGEVAAERSDGAGPAMTLRAVDLGATWQVAGAGVPVAVSASLPALAAWLTGRPASRDTVTDGGALPELPPWL